MNIISYSLPLTDDNISKIRKFARRDGLSLVEVDSSKDLWNLKDIHSGDIVLKNESLLNIHQYLCTPN